MFIAHEPLSSPVPTLVYFYEQVAEHFDLFVLSVTGMMNILIYLIEMKIARPSLG